MLEFELLNSHVKQFSTDTMLGPGDDCSAIMQTDGTFLVETTDSLIEDIHFRLRYFSPEELAHKCLMVNLSDISAMGAQPERVHLSLAVPKGMAKEWVREFFNTFNSLCEKYGIKIMGGDLCASPGPIFANVHAAGRVSKENIKRRQGLSEAGVLFVSGNLGDSAAGLYCLENSLQHNFSKTLISAHKTVPDESEKARWLGGKEQVLGMMDISDGLQSDLQRVEGGYCRINLEKIPMSEELKALAKIENKDPFEWALAGGEDYRLLGCCQSQAWESLKSQYQDRFAAPLFSIGRVETSEVRVVDYLLNGEKQTLSFTPFSHF